MSIQAVHLVGLTWHDCNNSIVCLERKYSQLLLPDKSQQQIPWKYRQ